MPQRIESAATASRIATLDLPAVIVTVPWPRAEIESGTPPTEGVESGAAVPEIGSRTGFPEDYACPFMPFLLIASAERHALDPQRYLTSVLARLPGLPQSDLGKLLPDAWKQADHPPDARLAKAE